jgi:hypothetical protein
MNPDRLPFEVEILGTDHDAAVVHVFLVKSDKVSTVPREDGALCQRCETQDSLIRYSLSSVTRLLHRQHVVTERAQPQDHTEREVLVGTKPRQRLLLLVFVLSDLLGDLVRVESRIDASADEIRGRKRREIGENLGISSARSPKALNGPDRNPRPHETG